MIGSHQTSARIWLLGHRWLAVCLTPARNTGRCCGVEVLTISCLPSADRRVTVTPITVTRLHRQQHSLPTRSYCWHLSSSSSLCSQWQRKYFKLGGEKQWHCGPCGKREAGEHQFSSILNFGLLENCRDFFLARIFLSKNAKFWVTKTHLEDIQGQYWKFGHPWFLLSEICGRQSEFWRKWPAVSVEKLPLSAPPTF